MTCNIQKLSFAYFVSLFYASALAYISVPPRIRHFYTEQMWNVILYPGEVKSTTTKSLVNRTIIAVGS